MNEAPKTEFATPADLVRHLERIAGDAYPRTVDPQWAAMVNELEGCIRRMWARLTAGAS